MEFWEGAYKINFLFFKKWVYLLSTAVKIWFISITLLFNIMFINIELISLGYYWKFLNLSVHIISGKHLIENIFQNEVHYYWDMGERAKGDHCIHQILYIYFPVGFCVHFSPSKFYVSIFWLLHYTFTVFNCITSLKFYIYVAYIL